MGRKAYLHDDKMIIYQIHNKINGKSYVGQASNGFRCRYTSSNWWKFIKNNHLKNSISKYGHESFEIIILEKNISSKEELNKLEIEYITKLNCIFPNGYNYQAGGQFIKNRKHNEITVEKIIKSHGLGIHKLLDNKTMKIIEFTNISKFARENHIGDANLSIVLKRNKHRTHIGQWSLPEFPLRRTKFISPDGEEYIVIDDVDGGIKGFCQKVDLWSTSIFAALKRKQNKFKGWKIEYLN